MTVLTFPSSPQNGDTYSAPNGTLYTYDGVKWSVTTTTITSDAVTNFVQDAVSQMFEDIGLTYNTETNTLTGSANTDRIIYGDHSFAIDADGFLFLDGVIFTGGGASTGDFTFSGPAVRTPNDATLAIESWTGGEGGLDPYLRADLELNSSTADARLASWTKAVAEFREEWSNWQTATWNDNGNGYGNLVFTGATGLFNLFNTNISYADNITISVNDGTPFAMNNGFGSGDVGSINIGTSGGFTLDPATVTKIVITYYARASVTANSNGGGVRIQGGEGAVYVNSLYDVNLNSNRISLSTTANSGGVTIATDQGLGGTNKSWSFNADGSLGLPYNGLVTQGNTRIRSASGSFNLNTPTVIWSSSASYISSAKLVIQVESEETGDTSGMHTQACEAVISSRGWNNGLGEPVMAVYGVVHTSVDILATFTVQRNQNTNLIEVLATPTVTTSGGGMYYGVNAVEITTWD